MAMSDRPGIGLMGALPSVTHLMWPLRAFSSRLRLYVRRNDVC